MRVSLNKSIEPELAEKLRKHVYGIIGCGQEVHRELGPFLNEYMYQDAMEIMLKEKGIPYDREHHFSAQFHGQTIQHQHRVDFLCMENVIVECKAVETLGNEHRQQLWNYMRLSGIRIGILYNFAPIRDQIEKYYYDPESKYISGF